MIAEIHSAVGLVLDHARFAAMHTDEAEAAQQMQAFRQQRPQPLLHAQTVLQQQNLGSGASAARIRGASSSLPVVLAPTSNQSQGGMSCAEW